MTRPRSQLVSLDATPYYHCMSRCVRRAWLCGKDPLSGRSFDHRKGWLVERLALLGGIFAINIAAYAVMSNHFHLVLHIDRQRARRWSDDEVLHRWTRLYKGPPLVQRYLAGSSLMRAEREELKGMIRAIRAKLSNISSFMAALNVSIARRANIEDECTGRFWEGRFSSKALLDEAGLLSCMSYVDLNPVRAGIAEGLEDSDFTSIQDRILALQGTVKAGEAHKPASPAPLVKPVLMAFSDTEQDSDGAAVLPFRTKDYIELTEWTGRCIRGDKTGYIAANIPPILESLGISPGQWQVLALQVQKQSISMLNGLDALAKHERRAAKHKGA